MKVYILHNLYYDHIECVGGDMTLGVYAEQTSAHQAIQAFIDDSMQEDALNKRLGKDYNNNPVIETFVGSGILCGQLAYSETLMVTEWELK